MNHCKLTLCVNAIVNRAFMFVGPSPCFSLDFYLNPPYMNLSFRVSEIFLAEANLATGKNGSVHPSRVLQS